MRIEILYSEGCGHSGSTLALVREVLDELGCEAEIRELRVADPAEAERLRFLGSPTVRVDGVDVEPDATSRIAFGVA